MKRNVRRRRIGLLSLVLIVVAGIVAALVVFAGTSDNQFTATAYSDVVRFQADGVATLQVQVFDLSGKVVWDSSVVSGDTIDWDRNNDLGERLAYGAYLYSAQGWSASGELIFKKNGKLALMPGDKVQLQAAPLPTPLSPFNPLEDRALTVQPKGLGDTGIFGHVGIATTSPNALLQVYHPASVWGRFAHYGDGTYGFFYEQGTGSGFVPYFYGICQDANDLFLLGGKIEPEDDLGSVPVFRMDARLTSNAPVVTRPLFSVANFNYDKLVVMPQGDVGIGTKSTTARLTIEASSGDLIAAYNSSSRVADAAVFVVKNTGEVHADGAYYGASFNAGSADVAERINTSEWVEPGNVVEIDPEHPGFFRKATSAYSTKVAGIISTSPGVILGNKAADEATDKWEDSRPVLAVTGRVPCKVSAENGPIQIGDLLVASSTPGIAMKGNSDKAMGAVVGKAMEPLDEGEGTIVVQVMLR